MPEIEFTRQQNIVVDKVGEETTPYGKYFTWSDKEGKSYKVKWERKPHFEQVIISEAAVQLNYSMSQYGKEILWSVERVADKLPDKVSPDEQFKAVEKEQLDKAKPDNMTKSDWEAKDRITRKSIERQTALNASVELAKLSKGQVTPNVIMDVAQLFEVYLEGKYVKDVSKNKLVEVAKKLGAEEVEQ